jgi:hypothetical protein
MAISAANATKINKMNKASQNVSLGTIIQELQVSGSSSSGTIDVRVTALEANKVLTAGSITVTSTHTNASVVTVATGLTTVDGYIIQAYAATGSQIGGNPYVKRSSGNILVMARDAVYSISGSFVLTAGDYYMWEAWEK